MFIPKFYYEMETGGGFGGTEEVANLTDTSVDTTTEDTTEATDDTTADESGGVDNTSEDVVDPPQTKQTPEQDRAFAQLRREAEQAKRELAARDQWVADTFGKTHGITSWEQYQTAMQHTMEQQRVQQQQQMQNDINRAVQDMRDQGYPEYMIQNYVNSMHTQQVVQQLQQELTMTKQQQQQMEQMKQQEVAQAKLNADFSLLQAKYPEFKTLDDFDTIPPDNFQVMNAVYSATGDLVKAYEAANIEHIRKKTTAAAKQQVLNAVNGKSHLKSEGGGNEVDATTIDPEVLANYKRMFPNKSVDEFVKHYKKSNRRK